MPLFDDLPPEVRARARAGIQIHTVSTPAHRGILVYETPRFPSAVNPAYGSDIRRGHRDVWLAAYVADHVGRLRYGARADVIPTRPLDGSVFAATVGCGRETGLASHRPDALIPAHEGLFPRFFHGLVAGALAPGRGLPDLEGREAWEGPVLASLVDGFRKRLEADLFPALSAGEREAWEIADGSASYNHETHDVLRSPGPEAAILRAHARRQPYFCGEALSHKEVREALVSGKPDREALAMASELAHGHNTGRYLRWMPKGHVLALEGRRYVGRPGADAIAWYGNLPAEWYPRDGEEGDFAYAINLAENVGFERKDARKALPAGGRGWAAYRAKLEAMAMVLGEPPRDTFLGMAERFREGVLLPLALLSGDSRLITHASRSTLSRRDSVMETLGASVLCDGLDLGARMAMLGRYRAAMPAIAGAESRNRSLAGPSVWMVDTEPACRYLIGRGVEAWLQGVARIPSRAMVNCASGPTYRERGTPEALRAPVADGTDAPRSPEPGKFDPWLLDRRLEPVEAPPEPDVILDRKVLVDCRAPAFEGGVTLVISVVRDEVSDTAGITAEELVRAVLGSPDVETGRLGEAALDALGCRALFAVAPLTDEDGIKDVKVRPDRDAVEAVLRAWDKVLPRGLRGTGPDGMLGRMRDINDPGGRKAEIHDWLERLRESLVED